MLEKIAKDIEMPEVKPLGNGLYRFPNGLVGGERFLQEFEKGFESFVCYGIEEYSVDEKGNVKFLI